MNDSQKRINAYKELLPGLKEKVAAMLVLLLVSTTMLITVSFAWVALTTSPEVTGVNTSIAANGNLEIALVGEEGNMPDESKVGDSALELIARNITWGNLINLGDPVYGLDHMVLRPAILNEDDLLGSPLKAAVYDKDGRFDALSSEFAFAKWVEGEGFIPAGMNEQLYGVRAIASVKRETSNKSLQQFLDMVAAVNNKNDSAGQKYLELTQDSASMGSLATVMGVYMTARMNSSHETLKNPEVKTEDIQNLNKMYITFVEAFAIEEQALVSLANLQLFAINGGDKSKYVEYTVDSLRENKAKISSKNISDGDTDGDGIRDTVKILDLNTFYDDYDKMILNQKRLEQVSTIGNFKWLDPFTDENGDSFDLKTLVSDMVNVGTCTVHNSEKPTPTEINAIGATAALDYVGKSNTATITNGVIWNFETRVGVSMNVKDMKISVSINRDLPIVGNQTLSQSVSATIVTNAEKPSTFSKEMKDVESMFQGEYIDKAKDIYGLAVDFWVRTNAQGSYLTLEGNVLTKKEMVRDTKNIGGETYELYSYSYSYEDEESKETVILDYTLYKEDGKWYNADSVAEFSPPDPNKFKDEDVKEKYSEVETVIGYEGTNRVWGSDSTLSVNSTTQGSGSCYVYYAETPEDQMRSLKLLESMKVAFVDADGNLLARAHMDTEHYYAENGKVIVPIVLDSDKSINIGTDEHDNTKYAITALEQNVPTMITAIMYLDGNNVTNNEVLSSADIQGQINIQFGSSKQLVAFENEELKLQSLELSASVDKTSFNFDDESEMKVNVTVKVDGTTPKTVKAFFLRAITATQGTREGEMTFTKENGNTWKSSYTFNVPGTYILRSVQLDGITYDLPADKCPVVTIEGFTVRSIDWDQPTSDAMFMTAKTVVSADLDLEFATNDRTKMPNKVVGRFMREEDGSVNNVEFTYNPTSTKWEGTVNFRVSGNYTLNMLLLDGQYQEVTDSMQKTAEVYLGMKVFVTSASPTNFLYENGMPDNQKNLYMEVKIMDDIGNEITGLKDVKLFYKSRSSNLDSRGLETDLTWTVSGSKGYYTGTFKSQVGMFDFSRVQVGENIITNATSSPSFIIQSPTPPKFIKDHTVAYQYSPEGSDSASLVVELDENAQALSYIKAVLIKNGTEYETLIDGELMGDSGNNTYYWTFKIPKNEDNCQEGVWSIKEIQIADVGTYTPEAPLVFDLTGKAVETTVVSRILVNFTKTENVVLDGTFLQEHKLDKFEVTISDVYGNKIANVKDVKVTYSHGNNSSTYGGYTIDGYDSSTDGTYNMTFTSSDGKKFTQEGNTTLKFAGTYSLKKLEFTFGNNVNVVYEGNDLPVAAKFTVNSPTPSVKITAALNSDKTIAIDTGNASGHKDSQAVPKFTTTEAEVYFTCQKNTTCGIDTHNYPASGHPYVTITMSNLGNSGSTATLNFASGSHIYVGTDSNRGSATTYTWSSDGDCKRYIGYASEKSSQSDSKTVAGTITANKITIVNGGRTFAVSIPTITIKNPY